MPFFLVDDGMPFHAKIVAAGNAAVGLWVRAGAWSQQPANMTEGFIPTAVARTLGTPAQIRKLVDVRLWHVADGGYDFHDWLGVQRSKAELEERRQKRATAGRLGGQRSGKARRSKSGSDGEANASTSTPHPNRTSVSDENVSHPSPESDIAKAETRLPAETPLGDEASASHLLKQNRSENEPGIRYPEGIHGYVQSGSYVSDARAEENPPQKSPPRGPAVDPHGWRLVREVIPDDHPQAVRTDLAIRAGGLLKSGTPEADVTAALALWLTKPALGPAVLPSLVSEVVRTRARPATPPPTEGAAVNKFRGWLEVSDQLDGGHPTAAHHGINPFDPRAIQQ